MKIKKTKRSKVSKLERDIMVAGAVHASEDDMKELQDKISQDEKGGKEWSLVIPPEVQKKMEKFGLSEEDILKIFTGKKGK